MLTTDMKTRKLIGVSRHTMEEAQKSLKIGPKMLAKQSNAMLAIEEDVKQLTGNVLISKSVQLQTEYMGT